MSVTAPAGFVAAGVASGIKPSGQRDLALVATADRRPVTAAGVFTANRFTAAPVVVSRRHLARSAGQAAAVILNSGNANAGTGRAGEDNAEFMASSAAAALGCATEHVLVCSTGLIGFDLPVERIPDGVGALVAGLSQDGTDAAAAIMTTDTVAKEVVVSGAGFTVGGMAKGAAMLAPSMATMLAVLTTDAAVDRPDLLTTALQKAVAGSFNRLSVDGCRSTNDTVLVLASGRAGAVAPTDLTAALAEACGSLADQMAADAEGATKVVRITVTGARSDAEAEQGARTVATSVLCRCSFYGADPYWGRIASELGVAGIDLDPSRLSISYGGVEVARGGVAVPHDTAAVVRHMAGDRLDVRADLGLGSGEGWVQTTDLTHAYIDENMRTS